MVLRKSASLYSFAMAIMCIFQVAVEARRNWKYVCFEKSLYGHSVCQHLSSVLYEVERRTQYIKELEIVKARMELLEENTNARIIESIEQVTNARIIESLELNMNTRIIESLEQNMNARMESLEQITNARMESLEENMDARMKSLERNTNARMESLEENMNERIESFEGNVNARMESLEKNTNERMESFKGNMNTRIESFEKNTNSRMEWLVEMMSTRLKSLEEEMKSRMELQKEPSIMISGPKFLADLNETWHGVKNKMQNITSFEEKFDVQGMINSKFGIIEEIVYRNRNNTKKLKERLDSVESELSNLTNSEPISQMSEKIHSFRKALESINETVHDVQKSLVNMLLNKRSEESRQSLLEMNSKKLQDLENVKAQVGFLRIANSVSQHGLEELRNKIKNVENRILEIDQYHRKETRDSDQDDSSKENGSDDKPSYRSEENGSDDKPYDTEGSADKPYETEGSAEEPLYF